MAWLPTITTIAPESEMLTAEEAKAQCRVVDTSEDALIDSLRAAARAHIEDVCAVRVIEQTVEMRASCWGDLESLPIRPVSEVTNITYLDSSGSLQTLSTDVYQAGLYGLRPFIRLKFGQCWPALQPADDAITITAVAGFDTTPPALRHAALLLVGHWFEHREAVSENQTWDVPMTVEALLANFRV